MNHWPKDMIGWEYLGSHRTVTSAWWLGLALVAQSWRLPFTATIAAFRRHAGGDRVRMARMSDAWLREHEADTAKHDT